MILAVVGYAGYLFGAKPVTQTITRNFASTIDLANGKSYYIWYNISNSRILKNQTLHASFTVMDNGKIDFYVMSDFQYNEWKNGANASGLVEERAKNSGDTVFAPLNYGIYYLILDNSHYNVSELVTFRCAWIATADSVNYSDSYVWLGFSGVSLCAVAALNMLLDNPIRKSPSKLLRGASLKQANSVRHAEDLKLRIDDSLRFFWTFLALMLVVIIVLFIRNILINISFFQDFPELFPMSLDMLLRIFSYYGLGLLFIAALFLFFEWLYGFLDDVQVWYLSKRGLEWNADLNLRSHEILISMLFTTTSIVSYVFAGVFLIVGVYVPNLRFPLVAIGTLIVSIPFCRAAFASFCQACEAQGLKWRKELRRSKPFTINGVVIAILLFPIFLLSLSLIFPIVLNILDAIIINSFPRPVFQSFFHNELDPRRQFSGALAVVTAYAVIPSSLLFLLVFCATQYLMPQMTKRISRRRKVKLLATPVIAALMAFATCEVYTRFVEVAYSSGPEWSIVISLVAFAVTYLIGVAYEEATKEHRHKRTLKINAPLFLP
jgi:hypothetical protein